MVMAWCAELTITMRLSVSKDNDNWMSTGCCIAWHGARVKWQGRGALGGVLELRHGHTVSSRYWGDEQGRAMGGACWLKSSAGHA